MLCKGTLSGRSPSNVVIEESLMKGNPEVDRGKGTHRDGEGRLLPTGARNKGCHYHPLA